MQLRGLRYERLSGCFQQLKAKNRATS
jgi:hypothetical protein